MMSEEKRAYWQERILVEKLKNLPSYKELKKQKIIVSLVAVPLILLFMVIGFSWLTKGSLMGVILYGFLILCAILIGRNVIEIFVEPKNVYRTVIMDVKKHERTVRENDMLRTAVSYTYLIITSDDSEHWVSSINDYLNKSTKSYNIGDSVIYFKLHKNEYIVLDK